MKYIFVDTSAWCAIEDKGDKYHAEALSFKEDVDLIKKIKAVSDKLAAFIF